MVGRRKKVERFQVIPGFKEHYRFDIKHLRVFNNKTNKYMEFRTSDTDGMRIALVKEDGRKGMITQRQLIDNHIGFNETYFYSNNAIKREKEQIAYLRSRSDRLERSGRLLIPKPSNKREEDPE